MYRSIGSCIELCLRTAILFFFFFFFFFFGPSAFPHGPLTVLALSKTQQLGSPNSFFFVFLSLCNPAYQLYFYCRSLMDIASPYPFFCLPRARRILYEKGYWTSMKPSLIVPESSHRLLFAAFRHHHHLSTYLLPFFFFFFFTYRA
jgi:hypothetical protein